MWDIELEKSPSLDAREKRTITLGDMRSSALGLLDPTTVRVGLVSYQSVETFDCMSTGWCDDYKIIVNYESFMNGSEPLSITVRGVDYTYVAYVGQIFIFQKA